MNTIVLRTILKLLIPLLVTFSLYLLFRGHNAPGGGFIGGLIASLPFIFYAMINGVKKAREVFRLNVFTLIGLGLLLAATSGLFSLFFKSEPYLTALWADFYLPAFGKPGTPIMFDIGVYLLVIGIVLRITFSMAEE